MAPHIQIAGQRTRLINTAAWHMDRADELEHAIARAYSEEHRDMLRREFDRHDLIAFRLFREAHEMAAA